MHEHHVELEQPVLKSIARRLEKSYVVMLDGLTEKLAGVLRRARGDVSKSESFYISEYVGRPAGASDDLVKAAAPKMLGQGGMYVEDNRGVPTGKAPKAAKAPRGAKAKSAAPRKAGGAQKKWSGKARGPGSHGSTKWWRDEHGHVHYGEKPPEREGNWKQLNEDEVGQLHTKLNVVFGYSPEVTNWATDYLAKQGCNVNLHQVMEEADANGLSLKDYLELTCANAKDAKAVAKAIANTVKAYEKLLKNKEFLAHAKSAIVRKKHADSVIIQKALRTKEYTEGATKAMLDSKSGALRTAALISDMELLQVPESITDARLDFNEDDEEAAARVGYVRVDPDAVRLFQKRASELTPEQATALWVARRIEEHQNGISHLSDGKQEAYGLGTADKLGKKVKNRAKHEAAQSFNGLLNDMAMDAIGGNRKAALVKLNTLANDVRKKMQEMNDGDSELEMVMTGEVSPRDLFEKKDAANGLKARYEAKKKRVQDMLDAQEGKGGVLKTPEVIKKALGADLFEYQRKFLGWMKAAKRGVLAAGAGTGKTPTSIAFVAMLKEQAAKGRLDKRDARGLLILPPSVVEQWPSEIAKFYPDAKVVVIGDDVNGVEDRITLLNAINKGDVEADFVIMSSSVLNPTRSTLDAFKRSKVFDYNEETNEAKAKEGATEEAVRDELRSHMKNDALTQALRGLRGCAFFDEAHSSAQGLKSDLNTHNAIARELMHGREHGFFLTATPTPNGDANELHNLVDCVSPGALGSKKMFAGRFNALLKEVKPRKKKGEAFASSDASEAANAVTQHNRYVAARPFSRLLGAYVYRKDKQDKDVVDSAKKAGMSVLPNINITHHHLLPTATESKIYADAGEIQPHYWGSEEHRKEMGDDYEDFSPASAQENHLAASGKRRAQLDALSLSPQILLGDGKSAASKALWKKYGYKGEETKIDHFINTIGEHFSDPANKDKPVVIFCDQPRAFERCRARLEKDLGIPASLTAEISGNVIDRGDRNSAQNAINAAKQKVIFVGTQAGGAGLNLQKASHTVIDLNTPWTAADKEQTQGRVWRTGQKHDVDSHVFSIAGSGDYNRLQKIKEKNERDVLMAYVKDGNPDVVNKIIKAKNYLLAAEGAKDERHTTPGVQVKKWKLPPELRSQFSAKAFRDTVDFDRYMQTGDQGISSKRALAQANLAKGAITKEQHAKITKKLDAEQATWNRYKAVLGKQPVLVKKGEQAFSAKKADAKTLKKLSPEAKALHATLTKHGGKTGMSQEGYTRQHLQAAVEDQLKKLGDNNRAEAVRQHYINNRVLEGKTKAAFKELEKHGLLVRGGKKK